MNIFCQSGAAGGFLPPLSLCDFLCLSCLSVCLSVWGGDARGSTSSQLAARLTHRSAEPGSAGEPGSAPKCPAPPR
jgi:hypothetical protein